MNTVLKARTAMGPVMARTMATPSYMMDATQNDMAKISDALKEHGFVIISGLLSPALVDSIGAKLLGYTDHVMNTLESTGAPIKVGSRYSYDEVVLRSPNRFDIPMSFSSFAAEELRPFEQMAEHMLDGDWTPAFCGLINSKPGSSAQEWHADSLHLTKNNTNPNLINVLLALHDVDIQMGPTELVPRSQHLTNHLRVESVTEDIVYQKKTNNPEKIGSDQKPFQSPMQKGTILAFDDRILHRGQANNSQTDRNIGYFSFRRNEFEADTHFEGFRSLFKWEGLHSSSKSTSGHNAEQVREGGTIAEVREEFPGLVEYAEKGFVVCDGAGGSQVHASVFQAMEEQMKLGSANVGGYYPSSERVLATVKSTREAAADLFHCDPSEVVFGHNATSLVSHVAHSIRHILGPGDNIVVSQLDHDTNAGLWMRAAEDARAEVRVMPVLGPDARLDYSVLPNIIDSNTKFVACGYAANSVGTINDVSRVCAAAASVGAISMVDAVHYAPHGCLDVKQIGCDLMVASPYKFFGPHAGLLYGRRELMAPGALRPYKIRVADDNLPCEENFSMSPWEQGTQNYEAIAGTHACIEYIASLGRRFGGVMDGPSITDTTGANVHIGRRECIEAGWAVVEEHEDRIKKRFLEGASDIPGLQVLGIQSPARLRDRTCTFAVHKDGHEPDALTQLLVNKHQVCCTSGNHYCNFWENVFPGTTNQDGAVRLGFLHYNTLEEVDRVLEALENV